jgi:L,D-transpeptidase ErfK/SrfK
MFPEDIDYLFGRVDVSTAVRIVNEPVKFGWDGDELVVEVHPTLDVASPEPETGSEPGSDPSSELIEEAPTPRDAMTLLTAQFVLATNEQPAELDWAIAEELLQLASGIPTIAGRKIKDAATSAASK